MIDLESFIIRNADVRCSGATNFFIILIRNFLVIEVLAVVVARCFALKRHVLLHNLFFQVLICVVP